MNSSRHKMDSIFQDHQLHNYTDAQLLRHIENAPRLKHTRAIPLSPKYLAKGYRTGAEDASLRAIEIASGLGIPVPRVHRTVQEENTSYCIMDHVPGKTLEAAWQGLGWMATIKIALQLRRQSSHLRQAH